MNEKELVQKIANESPFSLYNMPNEVFGYIVTFINVKDRIRLALTCKKFYKLIVNDKYIFARCVQCQDLKHVRELCSEKKFELAGKTLSYILKKLESSEKVSLGQQVYNQTQKLATNVWGFQLACAIARLKLYIASQRKGGLTYSFGNLILYIRVKERMRVDLNNSFFHLLKSVETCKLYKSFFDAIKTYEGKKHVIESFIKRGEENWKNKDTRNRGWHPDILGIEFNIRVTSLNCHMPLYIILFSENEEFKKQATKFLISNIESSAVPLRMIVNILTPRERISRRHSTPSSSSLYSNNPYMMQLFEFVSNRAYILHKMDLLGKIQEGSITPSSVKKDSITKLKSIAKDPQNQDSEAAKHALSSVLRAESLSWPRKVIVIFLLIVAFIHLLKYIPVGEEEL